MAFHTIADRRGSIVRTPHYVAMPSVDCLVLIGRFLRRLPLLLHLETALGVGFSSQDEAEAAALRVISSANISG
jgi:hypothetical protein